jgi:hypothetical protein
MTADALDRMLDELESTMPPAPSFAFLGIERHDWRPTWAMAKQIQEAFRDVRYPTKELRQAAWERFNALRDEASSRNSAEREQFRTRSERHLASIISDCKGIGYSDVQDTLFLDKTTVDQMKARGRYLGDVMKYLSDHKHEMLSEHKKDAFERIQVIKEQHDTFWQRQHEAREYRTDDRVRRVKANIEKNQGMLQQAYGALQRHRQKVSEVQEKIDGGSSDKWITIWEGWIAESEAKIEDIETQIRRIEGWIEEGEDELRKLR